MKIEVYSDGSGNSFGKPGGYAFVVVIDGVKVHEASGNEVNATNNTMELTAAAEGLKYVASDPNYKDADVSLISDSKLVLGFGSGEWKCKKLHLALLASTLRKLFIELKVTPIWVKGHTGNEFNELCDKLAGEARERLVI